MASRSTATGRKGDDCLQALIGQTIIGVEKGVGSFFYLRTSDAFRIWVYNSRWSFRHGASTPVKWRHFESAQELAATVGKAILALEVVADDWVLSLTGDCQFILRPSNFGGEAGQRFHVFQGERLVCTCD